MNRRRIALLALAGVVAAVFYVTQPFVSGPIEPRRPLVMDAASLEQDVRTLCEKFGPRDAAHPENLARIADWLKQEFAAAGGRVSEQPFPADGALYRNVSAFFGPESGPRIVVGAHYDTRGELPGADDNASGVAGLLALARAMKDEGALKTTVEFVAYPLEESPNFRTADMGSAVHADALARSGVEVRVMIGLEMIGRFSDEEGSQSYPLPLLSWLYPSRGDFIAVVGCLGEGLLVRRIKFAMIDDAPNLVSINAPRFVPGIDYSDHLNYWLHGFPAVMVTDTAYNRNRDYHTSGDTPDKLDYRRMARTLDAVRLAVFHLQE